jgi:hypothetical protein
VVLNLSEGLAAQIAVITMLAKDYPADDEALKIVVVERAVAVLRRLCKDGSVVSIFRRRADRRSALPDLLRRARARTRAPTRRSRLLIWQPRIRCVHAHDPEEAEGTDD